MSLGRRKLTHTWLAQGGPLDVPELKGKRVAVPLCGGNIDITVLGRVIERGLAADRRLVRFAVTVFFSVNQRRAGGWGGYTNCTPVGNAARSRRANMLPTRISHEHLGRVPCLRSRPCAAALH